MKVIVIKPVLYQNLSRKCLKRFKHVLTKQSEQFSNRRWLSSVRKFFFIQNCKPCSYKINLLHGYLFLIAHQKDLSCKTRSGLLDSDWFSASEIWVVMANSDLSSYRSTLLTVAFMHVSLFSDVCLEAWLIFTLYCSNGDASSADRVTNTQMYSTAWSGRQNFLVDRSELQCSLNAFTKNLQKFSSWSCRSIRLHSFIPPFRHHSSFRSLARNRAHALLSVELLLHTMYVYL